MLEIYLKNCAKNLVGNLAGNWSAKRDAIEIVIGSLERYSNWRERDRERLESDR